MRVDFHTHYIPKHFPDMAEKYGDLGWPTLLHTGLCQADIYNAGKHYRSIDDRSWQPECRLKDMDAEGVDIQVLSPIPVTFAYRFSAHAVLELSQYQNDEIARAAHVAPERFIGLGTVPLQDPALTSSEVRRPVIELGLAGVEIGTAIEGKTSMTPLWIHSGKPVRTLVQPFSFTRQPYSLPNEQVSIVCSIRWAIQPKRVSQQRRL